ncbi:RimK family alpha-L-glutamate ligase [Natronoglycomyces albus]|uniref:RimK family alpha-L-glutamate ligase n=1 Tax=Natronoglycomyces albus TaxID=2811108 RepID=A0A895XFR0_9ACTN|nr:RimK family alpha-L-glutamate ligase [Natronoglycomyces albus]QSB04164.1 RimK family alpha-L-glutamate ligase [Natronoglycomyces albus]
MNDVIVDVLLSVTKLRPEEKLLAAALRQQGKTVETILPADLGKVVNSGLTQSTGLKGSGSTPTTPPARMGLIRNLSHQQALQTARLLEYSGIPTLNRTSAIETCADKGLQSVLFACHGIPHPEARLAFGFDQVRYACADFGWPAVVKPVSGSWGRGVSRMVNEECLDAWVGGRESADAAGKLFPVLVQQYIEKPGHDLRVVVVGDNAIAAIARSSDDWRTNTTLGATVRACEITPAIRHLCKQVTDVLGPGFYGIDLIENHKTGELMVLEVNANPEFAKSSQVHGVDVAGRLASHIATVLDQQTTPAPILART